MEIQLWRSILCPYELAVRELEVKFNHIIDECKENDVYCPIEQVEGRVKSVSSILEKMQRKHIPMERMEEELEDIAGVRIICQFEEDIETVASMIQKRSDMTIKSEKNYLKHIKQSGYRSYHLIIYYTVDTIKGPKKLQAEIQIRTMAMNFWATIEHSLQYKYKGDMPEHVAERLSKAADAINALDHEMSSVRNEIMDAQNCFRCIGHKKNAHFYIEFRSARSREVNARRLKTSFPNVCTDFTTNFPAEKDV